MGTQEGRISHVITYLYISSSAMLTTVLNRQGASGQLRWPFAANFYLDGGMSDEN